MAPIICSICGSNHCNDRCFNTHAGDHVQDSLLYVCHNEECPVHKPDIAHLKDGLLIFPKQSKYYGRFKPVVEVNTRYGNAREKSHSDRQRRRSRSTERRHARPESRCGGPSRSQSVKMPQSDFEDPMRHGSHNRDLPKQSETHDESQKSRLRSRFERMGTTNPPSRPAESRERDRNGSSAKHTPSRSHRGSHRKR